MSIMPRRFRRRSRFLILIVTGITLAAVLAAVALAGDSDPTPSVVVMAVDRTRSVGSTATWSNEAGSIAYDTVVDARDSGAARLFLTGIGSTVADTAIAAEVDLTFSCPNDRRCEEDTDRVATQVAELAARLAATPPTSSGTDIVAALLTARELCGDYECKIVVASDLQDSRLAESGSAAEIARALAPSMPPFSGVAVALVGAGADGAPSDAVGRARLFFQTLLADAGTTPAITRNL